MKIVLKILSFLIVLFVGIAIGFFGGEVARVDFLCNEQAPAIATENLHFDGVVISKGAILPMRSCEYANRFTLHFGLPNKVEKDYFEYTNEPADSEKYAGGIGGVSDEQ